MAHDDDNGYDIEVLGQCRTNPQEGSQHTQNVEAKFLWSYAQEEALVALSEQGPDKCWHLITDPERRAKRIAARYADLYFASADKSRGKLQMLWPALAAFVVKDIVDAYRYSREDVLNGGWSNMARTSGPSQLVSELLTDASPYEHSLRVYAALAKGNLWLFMDIYPWLWFVLEYGLNRDGSLNADRLRSHVEERDASALQAQSRDAVKELPFGANWMKRLQARIEADPVYAHGRSYFQTAPTWGGMDGGYGQFEANAGQAHRYVKANVKNYDKGYRVPGSEYWGSFQQAFFVMEEERKELRRLSDDTGAIGRLQKVAQFKVTDEVRKTYSLFIDEYALDRAGKVSSQQEEVNIIAKQEQINVLQPLIYQDPKLIKTMDINHRISRASLGSLSPTYTLYFSSAPKNDDPALQATFDKPKGPWDYVTGKKMSLPNPTDRMVYVKELADKFNDLMKNRRSYMDGELQKIRGWLHA
ncbi:hypothetical protein KOL96_00030 (plasmid) [Ralstonia wenshanensis]|uniref:DUF2515 family protein n=1 Tax=Ralstonia TaxID=48736 RepID=UPI001E3F3880|nr:hypothetical protein [Ralstonia wenshanensis]UGS88687.1 hypothetical protein KOL96_00030 [Ralstonia wenshanensis]